MRSIRLVLALSILCAANGVAQSPEDGKVTGDAYTNTYFKFTYSLPKILHPSDPAALRLPQRSEYQNEFLLFAARQGDAPFGVVVIAERMSPTPHSRGFRDGPDFLDRVANSFKPEEHPRFQPRKHFTNAYGITFDQADYTDDSGMNSAMVTQMNGFIILFKSNAKTAADLEEMTKSIGDLRPAK
jgi:hypothetical protein